MGDLMSYVETIRADEARVGDVLSTDGYTITWACLLEGGGAPAEVSIVAVKDGHEKTAYLAPDFPLHMWREGQS